MIEPINSSNLFNNFRKRTNLKNTVVFENTQIKNSSELMSSQTAQATKAYTQQQISSKKTNFPAKIDFQTHKENLIKNGKVEGKDFEILNDSVMSTIRIYKNNKIAQDFLYPNADINDKNKTYFNYIEYSYPDEQTANKPLSVETHYTNRDDIRRIKTSYNKDNSPFKDDIANRKITHQELEKDFEEKNIPYTIESERNPQENIFKLISFDKINNKFIKYEFVDNKEQGQFIRKEISNKSAEIEDIIIFEHDKTVHINNK